MNIISSDNSILVTRLSPCDFNIRGNSNGSAFSLFKENSSSILLSGTGDALSKLVAEVKISTNPQNQLKLDSTGLLVIPEAIDSTDMFVKVSNSDTTAGYLKDKLLAGDYIKLIPESSGGNESLKVAVDIQALDEKYNLLILNYISNEPNLEVVDSNTIDFNASGYKGLRLTGSVKLEPVSTNSISIATGGLYSPKLIANNSSTITFAQSGPADNILTGYAKISFAEGNILIDNDGLYVAGGSTGGFVFQNDLPVKLKAGDSMGKYHNGDVIPSQGKGIEEVMLDIVTDLFPAVGSLTANPMPTSTEVGTSLNITLSGVYTQNDGLPLTKTVLYKNGTQLSTSLPYTDNGVVMSKSNISYNATFNDTINTNTITYVGLYKIFKGAVVSAPTTSADVRNLSSVFENEEIILNTGTSLIDFAFWIPNSKGLQAVVDLDALNLNITSEYEASDLSVNDAGGTPVAGKLYYKQQSVPYTTNHRHLITITDI